MHGIFTGLQIPFMFAFPMAVGAYDFGFFNLGQQPLLRSIAAEHNRYVGDLRLGIEMVKVHTVRWIGFPTILTGAIFQLGKALSPKSLTLPAALVVELFVVFLSLLVIVFEIGAHTGFAVTLNFFASTLFNLRAAD